MVVVMLPLWLTSLVIHYLTLLPQQVPIVLQAVADIVIDNIPIVGANTTVPGSDYTDVDTSTGWTLVMK